MPLWPEAAAAHIVVALLAAVVAFGIWADGTRWGGWLSGPVWTVLAAAALANLGALPHRSEIYTGITEFLVPAAVILFLLKADFRRIVTESGPTLIAYLIGAATSLIGILIAVFLFRLGADEPQVAGIMTANLIGGTVNVVAVAEAVGFNDPTRYAALLSGGAAAAVVYLALVGALASSSRLNRLLPGRAASSDRNSSAATVSNAAAHKSTAMELLVPLLLALAVVATSRVVSVMLGNPGFTIVFSTIGALLLANIFPGFMRSIRGDVEFGTMAMFCFFATIGAGVEFVQLLGPAALIAAFTLVAAAIHLALLLASARLFNLRASDTLIASIAGIMGPATAAAFAGGRGWRGLVTPGVMTGVLGIAIATFLGLAVERLVSFGTGADQPHRSVYIQD